MSFNKIFALGNLTRDPVVSQTNSGTSVVNGSITTNRGVPKSDGSIEDKVTHIEFVIWGKRGENFARFHRKGKLAHLEGTLEMESWTDKETGKMRTKHRILVTDWQFVGGKDKSAAPAEDNTPF